MEQIFFNVPLSKLEPVFKRWIKEAQAEMQHLQQKPVEQSERFLTIQEASEFLNLTVPTIYSKVNRKELPFMKRGKRLYFSDKELTQYLKGGKRKSNDELEAEANEYLKKKGGINA